MEESVTDLLLRFKEAATNYARALDHFELVLNRQRAVPPASDVLIETLKKWFDARCTAIEQQIADLIESRRVGRPVGTIIIFKGKDGGESE
jgi:hypothetical protein